MEDKKKMSLGTVIATSFGAIFWIVITLCHIQNLSNTPTLTLMIAFAVYWSFNAIIRTVRYLKQRKKVD